MRRHVTLFGSCLLVAASALAQQASTPAKSSTAPVIVPPQAPAPPANPITDAQAHEMMELTGASKMQGELVQGMTAYFQRSLPFVPKDVTDDLVQSLEKVDLQTPVIALYKQHISTTDAAAIIAFYKTPAGKDLIHVMPEIMLQSQQIGIQMGRKTAQEVMERHKDEIEAAAKKYQAEHAPKPAPSLNTPASPSSSAPASKPQQ